MHPLTPAALVAAFFVAGADVDCENPAYGSVFLWLCGAYRLMRAVAGRYLV